MDFPYISLFPDIFSLMFPYFGICVENSNAAVFHASYSNVFVAGNVYDFEPAFQSKVRYII